jgi:small subunit ribosomal protein S16
VAVRIRLQRKGAKHMAFYRIVATDSRAPRDGRFIEQLGYYDPLKDPADVSVDTDKVITWLSKGAQPSDTVRSLLSRVGIMRIWHEVRQGKKLDEVRHLEDEARKRIEARTAMLRREAAEAKKAKAKVAEEVKAEAEVAPTTSEEAEPPVEPAPTPDTEAEAGVEGGVAAVAVGGDAPEPQAGSDAAQGGEGSDEPEPSDPDKS